MLWNGLEANRGLWSKWIEVIERDDMISGGL